MSLPTWLPSVITFDGTHWDNYENEIYKDFEKNFIKSRPSIFSKPIMYKKEPMEKGKVATFWHLTTEGENESTRISSLDRCEKLCWIRPIIEHYTDADVKYWYVDRKPKTGGRSQKRLCIMLDCQEECVLVVLKEAPAYFVLLTFYPINKQYRKDKLIKEFEAYNKTNTAF